MLYKLMPVAGEEILRARENVSASVYLEQDSDLHLENMLFFNLILYAQEDVKSSSAGSKRCTN